MAGADGAGVGAADTDAVLKVADVVTLRFDGDNGARAGLLASQGFADPRLYVSWEEDSKFGLRFGDFEDCTFQVLPQYEYDAHKAHVRFVKRSVAAAKAAARGLPSVDATAPPPPSLGSLAGAGAGAGGSATPPPTVKGKDPAGVDLHDNPMFVPSGAGGSDATSASAGAGTAARPPTAPTPAPTTAHAPPSAAASGAGDRSRAKLNMLEANRDKEQQSNEQLLSSLAGRAVKYGDIIQLRHTKSQLFVEVQPDPASTEKNASAASLTDTATPACYFRVMPRFQLRSEGEVVQHGDLMLLQSVRSKDALFLHASDFAYADNSPRREVDAADDASAWRVALFAPPVADADLEAGAVLRLRHAESNGHLSFAPEPDALVAAVASGRHPPPAGPASGAAAAAAATATADDGVPAAASPYLRQCDTTAADAEPAGSNSLFTVELAFHRFRDRAGGAVPWDPSAGDDGAVSVPVRLRHVPTGRYLVVVAGDPPPASPRAGGPGDGDNGGDGDDGGHDRRSSGSGSTLAASQVQVVMLPPRVALQSPHDVASLFRLEATSTQAGANVAATACVRLRCLRLPFYVSMQPGAHESAAAVDDIHAVESFSVTPLPVACVSAEYRSDADAFVVEPAAMAEVLGVRTLLSLRHQLWVFVQRAAAGARLKHTFDVVRVLTTLLSLLEVKGLPDRRRQQCMREQRVMDALVAALQAPLQRIGREDVLRLDADAPLATTLHLVFRALKFSFLHYSQNEMYTSQWLAVLMKHARPRATKTQAVDMLNALLDDNRLLLEKAVDSSVIAEFVSMVAAGMDPQYLRFLTALCALEDEAVPRNQNFVTQHVLLNAANRRALLLRTHVVTTTGGGGGGAASTTPVSATATATAAAATDTPAPCTKESLRDKFRRRGKGGRAATASARGPPSPAAAVPPSPLQGRPPSAVVRAPGVYIESPNGAPWLPLAEFLAASPLVEYFAEQIDLLAEMCFGRNEDAMEAVEQHAGYAFATVLCVLRSDALDDSTPDRLQLKAAFLRLMFRLYVDRDPVTALTVPSLNRVYHGRDPFRECPADVVARFRGLCGFAVQYLADLPGQVAGEEQRNTLTLNVLQVVRFLVAAGVFTSSRTLLVPLVDALAKLLDGSRDTVPHLPGMKTSLEPRFQLSTATKPIMQAKRLVCETLRLLTQFQLDLDVQAVVAAFRKQRLTYVDNTDAIPGLRTLPSSALEEATGDGLGHDGVWLPVRAPSETPFPVSSNQLAEFHVIFEATPALGHDGHDDPDDDDDDGGDVFDADGTADGAALVSLDLDALSPGTDVDHALLDLTLYEDAELVNAAFSVLAARYQRHHATAATLTHVELLITDEVVRSVAQVRHAVHQLRSLSDVCAKLWTGAGAYSEDHAGEAARRGTGAGAGAGTGAGTGAGAGATMQQDLITRLDTLLDLCARVIPKTADATDVDIRTSRLPRSVSSPPPPSAVGSIIYRRVPPGKRWVAHREYQHLLRNLAAHDAVLELMRDLAQPLPAYRGMVAAVLAHCHALLQVFVFANKPNQEAVYAHVDMLIDHLPLRVGAHDTLAEVLRDHRALCTRLPDDAVRQTVESVDRLGCDPDLLAPLVACLHANGLIIRRSQALILKYLLDPRKLHGLFQVRPTDGHKPARSQLHTRFGRALGAPSRAQVGAGAGVGAGVGAGAGAATAAAHTVDGAYADFTQDTVSPAGTPTAAVDFDTPAPTAAGAAGAGTAPPPVLSDGSLPPVGGASNPVELRFLCRVVDLLTESSIGRQGGAEKRCQAVFPMADVMSLLRKLPAGEHWPVRASLLAFIFHVYLEVESSATRGNRSQFATMTGGLMALALHDASLLLAGLHADGGAHNNDDDGGGGGGVQLSPEQIDYVFRGMMPCVMQFAIDTDLRAAVDLPVERLRRLADAMAHLSQAAVTHVHRVAALNCLNALVRMLHDVASGGGGDDGDNDNDNGAAPPNLPSVVAAVLHLQRALGARNTLASTVAAKAVSTPKRRGSVVPFRLRPSAADRKLAAVRTAFKQLANGLAHAPAVTGMSEREFERLCFKFQASAAFSVRAKALINLLDVNDFNLSAGMSVNGLRILRKVVEMQRPGVTTPAAEWGVVTEWEAHRDAVTDRQHQLNALGVVPAIVSIIGQRPEPEVVLEAVRVACALLVGGNRDVQKAFRAAFKSPMAVNGFFSVLHGRITAAGRRVKDLNKLRKELTAAAEHKAGADVLAELPEPPSVHAELRLLQLLCEGHYTPLQLLMRSQAHITGKTHNLVRAVVGHLQVMERHANEAMLPEANQTVDTLVEFVQGPCRDNQTALLNAKVLDTATAIMSWTRPELDTRGIHPQVTLARAGSAAASADADTVLAQGEEQFGKDVRVIDNPLVNALMTACSRLLLALLEGTHDTDIPARVAATLNLGVIRSQLAYMYTTYRQEHGYKAGEPIDVLALPEDAYDDGDGYSVTLREGFELYALLRQLFVMVPAVRRAFDKALKHAPDPVFAEAFVFFEANTCQVEVVLGGHLERVFFAKPIICNHLTNATRDRICQSVDRDTPDAKLASLFDYKDEVQEEMQHRYNISRNPWLAPLSRHMELFKNFSFALAIIINVLILLSFGVLDTTEPDMSTQDLLDEITITDGDGPWSADGVDTLITVLGSLQTITSSIVAYTFFRTFAPLIILQRWQARAEARSREHQGQLSTVAPTRLSWLAWFKDPERPLRVLLNNGPRGLEAWSQARRAAAVHAAKANEDAVAAAIASGDLPDTVDAKGAGAGADSGVSRDLKSFVPLHVRAAKHFIELGFVLTNPMLVYLLAYVLFTFLGNAVSEFFFCFHLLDIVYRVATLQDVLRSVTHNGRQLAWTALLGVVIIYVYTIIGFNFYRPMFLLETRQGDEELVCESMYKCFLYTLNSGVRNGGGIGDSLPAPSFQDEPELYVTRLLFDLSFFAFVVVVLVNGVIFGIIIDTFADLRGIQQAKEEDMRGVCFICGIERAQFDRQGVSFSNHIRNAHNMWQYLFLVTYLRLKDETEMTGIESQLLELIQDDSTAWFPRQSALDLPDEETTSDDIADLAGRVSQLAASQADTQRMVASMAATLQRLAPIVTRLQAGDTV